VTEGSEHTASAASTSARIGADIARSMPFSKCPLLVALLENSPELLRVLK
jgi:hypothetical protein